MFLLYILQEHRLNKKFIL